MLERSLFKKPNIALEGAAQENSPNINGQSFAKCPACNRFVPEKDISEGFCVCSKCGHHVRISARKRIEIITDGNSFVEYDGNIISQNFIGFPGYEGKLSGAMEKSGEKDAVVTGTGRIGGNPCALFVMEGNFMMGSMGSVVGDKIARLFEYAMSRRLPVIGFTVSGGARMQEGMLSLMQMAKVSAAVGCHSDAGLLYIPVLTDPTTGGVTASFAMLGDIILAEPKALIAFAGPRVIEQTIRKQLPQGFQRAEMLLNKGFVDAIVDRRELKKTLAALLKMHRRGDL